MLKSVVNTFSKVHSIKAHGMSCSQIRYWSHASLPTIEEKYTSNLCEFVQTHFRVKVEKNWGHYKAICITRKHNKSRPYLPLKHGKTWLKMDLSHICKSFFLASRIISAWNNWIVTASSRYINNLNNNVKY